MLFLLFPYLRSIVCGHFAEQDRGSTVEYGEAQAMCLNRGETQDALVAYRGRLLAGIYGLPCFTVVILYSKRLDPLPEGDVLLQEDTVQPCAARQFQL